MTAIKLEDCRGTSPPAPPGAIGPRPHNSSDVPATAAEASTGKPSVGFGRRASDPVFQIKAVKNLCRQEQEDWWAAIVSDRVARTALFSLHEEEKTFQYWAGMAACPDNDLNVVYVQGPSAPGAPEAPQISTNLPASATDPSTGISSAGMGPGLSPGSPVAFFWTSGRYGHGGYLHFGFLEAGLPWKMAIGRYVLKVLAAAGYKCLASLTPVRNIHVVAYAQSLGGKLKGIWPGVCYMAERKEWSDGVLLQFILGP
jgi:hypothetical protein